MSVDAKYPGKANYEKVLSFIDSTMKERSSAVPLTNRYVKLRAHLHPATATSLPNLIYCFSVVLLH